MKERRGVVFPLLLIVVGTVWFMQTLEIVEAGTWVSLIKLWPVAVIAIGLGIVFGASRVGRGFIVAVTLGLVVGGLYLLGAIGSGGAADGDIKTRGGSSSSGGIDVAVPIEDATSAKVVLGPGIAQVEVGAQAAGDQNLMAGSVSHPRRSEAPTTEVKRDDGRVTAEIEQHGDVHVSFWPFERGDDYLWELDLTRDIPLDLDVDAGVGSISLDLSELMITDLKLDVGVGSLNVDLPGRGSYVVEIDGGVGSVVVTVPEGFEAKVEADIGVGGVSVPGGFSAFGEAQWETDGYDEASERVEINIDGGVGSIVVREDG